MADVLNRTTKQLLRSVNTSDYPETEWIVNPDLSAVANVPVKYWIIEGDSVREANATEKSQIDEDELAQLKTDLKAEIDQRQISAARHISTTERDSAKSDVDAATTLDAAQSAADEFLED